MNYVRRKHPRIYTKKTQIANENEKVIDLKASVAVGILACAFLKGLFIGYLIKRK